MSILKIEPGAINANADFSLGSLSVTGNINVGAAIIAATGSGALAFTTTSGTFGITANTVNFLNTVSNTSIAPGGSIVTESLTPRIVSVAYVGNDTAAAVAGGETLTITGSGFNYGAGVYISSAIVAVVTVNGPTQITFTSPAKAAGNYVLGVVNPDGASAIFVPGIQYSGVPTWTTAAGSLGAFDASTSFTSSFLATSDSAVLYSIVSGSLPPGITLNSATGVVAGTLPAVGTSTTYNFTVGANDAENQSTNRNFSITVTAVAAPGQQEFVTAGTYSWTAPAGVTTVSAVVVGGGGAGGVQYPYDAAGGGGGGGLAWKNNISVTPGQVYTVVVGAGGASRYSGAGVGASGQNSYFGTAQLVQGLGGEGGRFYGSAGGLGGVYVGDGGGNGGNGGWNPYGNICGGGGAGGYTGNGGNGSSISLGASTAGSGGGGGGGGSDPQGYPSRGGGGVGIYGQGANGAAGADINYNPESGGGGSGGTSAPNNGSQAGGVYGAGGGATGGGGGSGAVRIIWGAGRAFPATNTSNV